MYDVQGSFKVRYVGAVRSGKSADNKEYTMRSLGLAGDVLIGSQMEEVANLEVVVFRNPENDALWSGLGTLNQGDTVEAVVGLGWGSLKDKGGYSKTCLLPRGLLSLVVVERSLQNPVVRRTATFQDVKK